MPTLQAFVTVLQRLWTTGNLFARWALVVLVAWPPVLAVVAMLGSPALTATVGLVPVVALVFVFCAYVDPLVVPVLAAITYGRTGLQWLSTIFATELLLGVYFAVVPVHNDPGLVPLILLVGAALAFFSMGTTSQATTQVRIGLTILALVITALFVVGGRDRAAGMLGSLPFQATGER